MLQDTGLHTFCVYRWLQKIKKPIDNLPYFHKSLLQRYTYKSGYEVLIKIYILGGCRSVANANNAVIKV